MLEIPQIVPLSFFLFACAVRSTDKSCIQNSWSAGNGCRIDKTQATMKFGIGSLESLEITSVFWLSQFFPPWFYFGILRVAAPLKSRFLIWVSNQPKSCQSVPGGDVTWLGCWNWVMLVGKRVWFKTHLLVNIAKKTKWRQF